MFTKKQFILFPAQKDDLHVQHNNLIFPIRDKRNKHQHRAPVSDTWKSRLVAAAQMIANVYAHPSLCCNTFQNQTSIVHRKMVKATCAGTNINNKQLQW